MINNPEINGNTGQRIHHQRINRGNDGKIRLVQGNHGQTNAQGPVLNPRLNGDGQALF